MPWVYLDDHWDEHPKILEAFELDCQAPILFISGNTYCRRSGAKGLIPGPKVRGLLGWRPKAQKALVEAGLWHLVEPGKSIEVHDWEQWNHSEGQSASARNAAQVRWKREKEARGDA